MATIHQECPHIPHVTSEHAQVFLLKHLFQLLIFPGRLPDAASFTKLTFFKRCSLH